MRTCVRCSRPLPPIGSDLLRSCVACRIEIREKHRDQWSHLDMCESPDYRADEDLMDDYAFGPQWTANPDWPFDMRICTIEPGGLLALNPSGWVPCTERDSATQMEQTLDRLIQGNLPDEFFNQHLVPEHDWPQILAAARWFAYKLECEQRAGEGCPDIGSCHGPMVWCEWCGDAALNTCDDPNCFIHPRCRKCSLAWHACECESSEPMPPREVE